MNIREAIAQGKRLVTNGLILTITGTVSDGVYTYRDNQTPAGEGTITVGIDDEENLDLVVID